MNFNQRHIRGIVLTLIGGICWGYSGACGQILLNDMGIKPMWVTSIRMTVAGIILILISMFRQGKGAFDLFKNKNSVIRLLFFAVFGLCLCQTSYLITISYSNAGTATILQYLGPVFIMLYVCVREHHLPKKSEIFGVAMALGGVMLLATHGNFHSLNLSKECLFWGIFSAITLAFYSLLPAKLVRQYSSVSVTGFGLIIGGIIITIISKPWQDMIVISPKLINSLFGMIVLGTVVAYTLFLQGVADIGSVKASMIACIEPVSAAMFSFLWLGTKFYLYDIMGFALILSTVIILSLSKNNTN